SDVCSSDLAQLWRSIQFVVPGVVLIALTGAALFAWGKAPLKGTYGQGWYAPGAVAIQLLAAAWLTLYLGRAVLAGGLPARYVAHLRPRHFARLERADSRTRF